MSVDTRWALIQLSSCMTLEAGWALTQYDPGDRDELWPSMSLEAGWALTQYDRRGQNERTQLCMCTCWSVCPVTNLNLGRLQYRDITDDPDATVERVTGLNPNTTYRVYLKAATSVGTGEPIFVDATTEISGRKHCCLPQSLLAVIDSRRVVLSLLFVECLRRMKCWIESMSTHRHSIRIHGVQLIPGGPAVYWRWELKRYCQHVQVVLKCVEVCALWKKAVL